MKKILLFIFLFSFSLFGSVLHDVKTVSAQQTVTAGAEGASSQIQLTNPLGGQDGIKDIPSLVKKLLEIVLKIGVPLIALSIIYTGYLFIAAQGAPDKLTNAKNSLVYVVIGAAILLGAYVIAESIVGTINAIRGV